MYIGGVQGETPHLSRIMTLFQSIKQIKLEDGSDFNLPIGPAFFAKKEAQEWLNVSGLQSEGYQVQEVAPMTMA